MLPLAQLKNLHKLRYAVVLVSTQKCCYLLTLTMLACLSLCLILHLWDKRCSPTNCQALSSKRWTKPSTLNNEKNMPWEKPIDPEVQRSQTPGELWSENSSHPRRPTHAPHFIETETQRVTQSVLLAFPWLWQNTCASPSKGGCAMLQQPKIQPQFSLITSGLWR